METLPDVYPLTSLQIGDIQSYLSRIFLYFAPVSNKLLILVDNRPWFMNKHPKSTKLWKLMVAKYRMSPFLITRVQCMNQNSGSNTATNDHLKSTSTKHEKLARWFSVIDAKKWQENSLFPLMDLSKALHGFIVFEVTWKDVRGINFLNELQADTSLALEVKTMKKWEFNSIEQSLSCISSWFSGTVSETQSLLHNLKLLSNMDAPLTCHQDLSLVSKERLSHVTSQFESFPENMFFDVQECAPEANDHGDDRKSCNTDCHPQDYLDPVNKPYHDSVSMPGDCEQKKSVKGMDSKEESNINFAQLLDTLLLFRFHDSNIHSKLRKIITSDLRLLALLESGLPSWVIFLQSYPILCKSYRPWMPPLARTLYTLISLVTVIIGFYDLYKNVPLLKATAASLCGPLFDWIEKWEMISRIRYLGTMLFLQNFERSVKWFLMVGHVIRPAISLLTKPLMGPVMEVVELISPVWCMFAKMGRLCFSTARVVLGSSYSTILYLAEVFLSPFGLLFSYLLTIVASLFYKAYYVLRDFWQSASSVTRFTSGAKPGGRSLWKDLLSQVFRATRSIINGFIIFFSSCNRHRLSIYNHVTAFLRRLYRLLRLTPYACSCRRAQKMEHHYHMVESEECDFCK
ncbi:uncharacterized protein LOC131246834 isoform X2 [Magnolia sinica]|uniref:uncharacterized protein LOC131246834 isoform X2 n=1 Tax=Magnolia sinica TaxID=86752 RepID=UPI002658F788|nr:uncharacterized protein LOC131246834 isoform X2 [Magnolia sinica]